jgi:hypothetical protein
MERKVKKKPNQVLPSRLNYPASIVECSDKPFFRKNK